LEGIKEALALAYHVNPYKSTRYVWGNFFLHGKTPMGKIQKKTLQDKNASFEAKVASNRLFRLRVLSRVTLPIFTCKNVLPSTFFTGKNISGRQLGRAIS